MVCSAKCAAFKMRANKESLNGFVAVVFKIFIPSTQTLIHLSGVAIRICNKDSQFEKFSCSREHFAPADLTRPNEFSSLALLE